MVISLELDIETALDEEDLWEKVSEVVSDIFRELDRGGG